MHKTGSFSKYLDEALGLGLFMFSAGFFDVLIEDTTLPVYHYIPSALARRFLVGLAMGLTALFIFTSKFGKASGAYINPAVTAIRYRLGDIGLKDALFYMLFQFAGGTAGLYVVALIFPLRITKPEINYIITIPGSEGIPLTFLLEFLISGILISVVLFTEKSKSLKDYTSYFVATLIVLYITFEAPYSGMSMNPARTFSSAVLANRWDAFWLYCTAPLLGMLCGCSLYQYSTKQSHIK